MRDVCIVTEGAWPFRTGGLATWTEHLTRALEGAEVSVISLGPAAWSSGAFEPARHVRDVEVVDRLRRLPPARLYVASGLAAAEGLLRADRSLARRVVYVEHGDVVGEALLGGVVCESGAPVTRGNRSDAAEDASRRRRAMVQTCGGVIGVTERTLRRVRSERAPRAGCVPNAVPPLPVVASAGARAVRAGFVGRFSRVKGIDRFASLALEGALDLVAVGMPAGEPWGGGSIEWRLAQGCPWIDQDFSALAMPSRLEASPFAALEAEARGVPVLLSDRASLRGSELITRLPWCPRCWARALDSLLRRGTDPAAGSRLAAARWGAFRDAWRSIVAAGSAPVTTRPGGAEEGGGSCVS